MTSIEKSKQYIASLFKENSRVRDPVVIDGLNVTGNDKLGHILAGNVYEASVIDYLIPRVF